MRLQTVYMLLLVSLASVLIQVSAQASNYRLRFGGDFTLTSHDGSPFSLQDARGKVVVLYFGFTHCPGICPTTLAKLGAALRQLGTLSDQVQPLFISVDTKRDTPQVLKDYTPYFHPSILGLTGTQEEVEAVARQYRGPVNVQKPDENDYYSVDHSSRLYLIAPDGGLANILVYETPSEKIASYIKALMKPGA